MNHDRFGALVLAAPAFEVCWERLGLGETPWQLDPPRIGSTTGQRRAHIAEVAAELRDRGLADERGPGPQLTTMLRLLAHPQWSLDLRRRSRDLLAGVVAARGGRAVLAVRHRDEITLHPVAPAAGVDAVLDLLGPISPGPGRPVCCTDDPCDPDAALLAGMCRDVHTMAQVGASRALGDGTRMQRAPWVVGVHATPSGHYRSVRTGPCGLTVEPLTRSRLVADAERLLAA